MSQRSIRDRVILHHDIGAMEIDLTSMHFASNEEVDAFFNEADRALEATGKRWYFLVVYTGCVIAPEVWLCRSPPFGSARSSSVSALVSSRKLRSWRSSAASWLRSSYVCVGLPELNTTPSSASSSRSKGQLPGRTQPTKSSAHDMQVMRVNGLIMTAS